MPPAARDQERSQPARLRHGAVQGGGAGRGPLDVGGVGEERVVGAVLAAAELEELQPRRERVGVEQALQARRRRRARCGRPPAGVPVGSCDAGEDWVVRAIHVSREVSVGTCGAERVEDEQKTQGGKS